MNMVYDSDIATYARSHLLDAMLLGETGIGILFSAPFICSILFYPTTLQGRLGSTDDFVAIPFYIFLCLFSSPS